MQNPRFIEIIRELEELHTSKNADYASTQDPLSNFADFGFLGAIVRIGDKYSRVRNFVKNGEYKVKSESVIDTLKDLAVYSIIAVQLYEREHLNKQNKCPACNKSLSGGD